MEEKISTILKTTFNTSLLEVVNESHMHSGPPNRETHFKVLIVSSDFTDMKRIERQRKVNLALKDCFDGGLHALSLRCLSPEEYNKSSDFQSPDCASKK